MSEEIVKHTNNSIAIRKGGIVLKTFGDVQQFAELVTSTDLCPKAYKRKPMDAMVAIQYGMELGLLPLQSLQNICVINGNPSVWGDAVKAICHAGGQMEDYAQEQIGTPYEDGYGWKITVKRKGMSPVAGTFTVADAKKAGLWGRNTWNNYPKVMLKQRARTFLLRDVFPDRLKGMYTREEMLDVAGVDDYTVVDDGELVKAIDSVPMETLDDIIPGVEAEDADFEEIPPEDEAPPPVPPTVNYKKRIGDMIMIMANDDKDICGAMLENFTTFTNDKEKVVPGKTTLKGLKDTQLRATYGKVKPEFLKYCEDHGIENTICGQH